MADVDSKLAASLRQAKANPMFFVFVAKGTEGKLLLDKKKISPKDASDAKKALGGGTIFKGRCHGEEGKLVFEIGKEPAPSLSPLTKKIIKQDAGLTMDVEYRFAADLAAEENEAESTGDAAAAAAPPPVSPPPPPPPAPAEGNPAALQFASKLKAIQPVLAKVESINKPVADQAKTQVAEGNKAFVAKQYDVANAALDRAQTILKQGLTAPAPSPSTSGADQGKATSEFTTRLKAIQPELVKVEAVNKPAADQAKAQIMEGNKAFVAKQFDAANAALDRAEAILKQGMTAAEPAAGADQAEWERRVTELEPKILAAQKTRAGEAKWMTLFMSAQDLGSEGEFAKSLAILDKLDELLNAAPTATVPTLSVMKLGKARMEWIQVRLHALREFRRLKDILHEEYKDDPEEQKALAASKARLDGLVASINEELGVQLDEVLNADPEQQQELIPVAKATLERFVRVIKSDDILSVIDGNEYAPDMQVAAPLTAKLQEIAAVLA